jgi:hypothetical protein
MRKNTNPPFFVVHTSDGVRHEFITPVEWQVRSDGVLRVTPRDDNSYFFVVRNVVWWG